MENGTNMHSYEKYKLISLIDDNCFEPIMNEPDEEDGDYKDSCERLIWLQGIIENKIEETNGEEHSLSESDIPEFLEKLFDLLDDTRTEDALFVLKGLDEILFDRILYTMRKSLENGSITNKDLEFPAE